jgi:hypothetical protein
MQSCSSTASSYSAISYLHASPMALLSRVESTVFSGVSRVNRLRLLTVRKSDTVSDLCTQIAIDLHSVLT